MHDKDMEQPRSDVGALCTLHDAAEKSSLLALPFDESQSVEWICTKA